MARVQGGTIKPPGPKYVAPKHGSLPSAMLDPRGYQHMSHQPHWGWRRSRHRCPGFGIAGAGQSVQPRRGWR